MAILYVICCYVADAVEQSRFIMACRHDGKWLASGANSGVWWRNGYASMAVWLCFTQVLVRKVQISLQGKRVKVKLWTHAPDEKKVYSTSTCLSKSSEFQVYARQGFDFCPSTLENPGKVHYLLLAKTNIP